MVGLGKFQPPEQCKCTSYSIGRWAFSPYLYCSHACIYCYELDGMRIKFNKHRFPNNVVANMDEVRKDYLKLPSGVEIEASPACDCFDESEKVHKKTLEFLKDIVPLREDVYITFITKNARIADDEYINLLPNNCIVQISIEAYGDKLKDISPGGSTYQQRLDAIAKLKKANILVGVRIDPIIPIYTTLEDVNKIMDDLIKLEVKHITTSFVKLIKKRIKSVQSKLGIDLESIMYKRTAKEYYVNDEIRMKYYNHMKLRCNINDMTFACCRECLMEDTGFCDPFHLIENKKGGEMF